MPLGSRNFGACLLVQDQEPWQMLHAWETQPYGQQEFWGLLSGMGFQELNTVELQAWGNQACWLVPSVTHGAAGALGPVYAGSPVSLTFLGAGRRLCSKEDCGALSSCVCQEAGLTAKHRVMEPGSMWTSGAEDQECFA
jgi:hypothetical protein